MRHVAIFTLVVLGHVSPIVAETWDPGDDFGTAGLLYANRVGETFDGTKIIFDGQYVLKSKLGEIGKDRECCSMPTQPERFSWLFQAHFQVGLDGTGLEYTRLGFIPKATTWEPVDEAYGKLKSTRDILEFGAVQFVVDDPLEVDSYLEIAAARGGRIWTYRKKPTSSFTFRVGAQASIGWAWAETNAPAYSTVSNPFAGIYFDLAVEHARWGKLYALARFANGFSFSNPSRGHPTAREARVRFGYAIRLPRCLSVDVFLEKRSFYFDEGGLPGLYTESEAIGASAGCHF